MSVMPDGKTVLLRNLRHELQVARSQRARLLEEFRIKRSIGCVDGLTQNGVVNVPGSILLYYYEYREELRRSLERIDGGEVVIKLHTHCAYLYAVRNLNTTRMHRQAIHELQQWIAGIARNRFRVRYIVETVGSAQPYMGTRSSGETPELAPA